VHGGPVEPPRTPWVLPDPALLEDPAEDADDDGQGDENGGEGDLVGVGADLEPGTVLAAYRLGLFPMPLGPPPVGGADGVTTTRRRGRQPAPIGWWSPARRGVLELDGLVVSRSLRRACRDVEVRVDTAFEQVVRACADPARPQGWIDSRVAAAYAELHRLGWAHSVEAWRGDRLVGGLYGLAIGGLFAGESMFHHERDASKTALVGLVEVLRAQQVTRPGPRLVDVQWSTPHLASLGVTEVPRSAYLGRLPDLLATPHADFAAT